MFACEKCGKATRVRRNPKKRNDDGYGCKRKRTCEACGHRFDTREVSEAAFNNAVRKRAMKETRDFTASIKEMLPDLVREVLRVARK